MHWLCSLGNFCYFCFNQGTYLFIQGAYELYDLFFHNYFNSFLTDLNFILFSIHVLLYEDRYFLFCCGTSNNTIL